MVPSDENGLEILRLPICRYVKSGKVVAIEGDAHGCRIFDLDAEMTMIKAIREPKFVKRGTISRGSQLAEISRQSTLEEDDAGNQLFSFRLVRVLSPGDLDKDMWSNTESLFDLPVCPLDLLTAEERVWAGERPGTIDSGVFILATLAFFAYWLVNPDLSNDIRLLCGAAVTVMVVVLARHKWRRTSGPDASRVQRLLDHKRELRESSRAQADASKTEFDRLLNNFGEWENMSPKSFEIAIARRLEKEGYLTEATRFSGDGGVDVEAIAPDGHSVIVQAKQYSGKVGVAVVREMIGVRETRGGHPRVVVFALNGFTRGAEKLAASASIELRSIRSEMLDE